MAVVKSSKAARSGSKFQEVEGDWLDVRYLLVGE
jgi:hypothetical protein